MKPFLMVVWAGALTLLSVGGLHAQSLTVLPMDQVRLISEEISGDAAYEHIRHNTQFHRPRGGADGLFEVARYYEEKAREYGLDDVQLIKQAYWIPPWNARSAELWIQGSEPERIASMLETPLHLADYSRSADITAELVDIGVADSEGYAAQDVEGKVVLTYGPLGDVMREAVGNRGAAGVVWYPNPFFEGTGTQPPGFDRPDQIRWVGIPAEAEGWEPTFAFNLSLRDGIALRNRISAASEPILVRARIDASFGSEAGDDPWQVMVEAFIRGTEPGIGQDIVLTGHMQEEKFSANDDASGTANVLEVGRALASLIAQGQLPRPRRNLRFWWVTEFSSQRQYFADHPEAHHEMWVNVNQDMVGADQSQDVLRKQNVTRLPASRFHFFNDVVESVVEYMVATNTYELAQAQAGIPMYPRPHLSKLGSRHRYNAEMIFFHANTDHIPFNEAPIGVPGITFTNMPDRFIHSSDDDLWNIDRTQLGRNAVAAALIAYTMATADERQVPILAAETAGRGAQRIARNLGLGLSWISRATDRAAAYHQAADQVRYAAERERLAAESLAEISPQAVEHVAPLVQAVDEREAQAVRELEAHYRRLSGGEAPTERIPSEGETRLSTLRPALNAGPGDFLEGRGQIRTVPGLHNLMSFEVLNLVDGNRTADDIYRYVAGQAREAGEHYYGAVTPDMVHRFLENSAEVGLIRLR